MTSIKRLVCTASTYAGEDALPDVFLRRLQGVLDSGGQVVAITKDEPRLKVAYVILQE